MEEELALLKGAEHVYATCVQGGRAPWPPAAHSSFLLRGALLTIHCLRQPRHPDHGSKQGHLPLVAALQHRVGTRRQALVLVGLLGTLSCATATNRFATPGVGAATREAKRQATPAKTVEAAVAMGTAKVASSCPGDMVALPSLCIDRYEAPNVRGQLPLYLRTAQDGEAWCEERGKRLCTENEWVRACEGPHGWRYPYGEEHRDSTCNDDRRWIPVHWDLLARWPNEAAYGEAKRLFQADPSGARDGCVSEEGVYDLTGNVAEWVRRSDPAPKPGYEHVLKGCYWAGCYHEPHPNCVFRNSAHPGSFRTYEAGFRCCLTSPSVASERSGEES